MSEGRAKSRTQIVLALIGLVGTLGAAAFASWDKLFPPDPVAGSPTPPAREEVAFAAEPSNYVLGRLTCIRPQEPSGEDRVYLRLGGSKPTRDWTLETGESVEIDRTVERGSHIALYEKDGFVRDGDDELLGEAEMSGGGGVLVFESQALGHRYELSYAPGS